MLLVYRSVFDSPPKMIPLNPLSYFCQLKFQFAQIPIQNTQTFKQ